MAKVNGEGYQYYVEAQDGSVIISDLLDVEGVLPGEILRLFIKGPEIAGMVTDRNYFFERQNNGSYSVRTWRTLNTPPSVLA